MPYVFINSWRILLSIINNIHKPFLVISELIKIELIQFIVQWLCFKWLNISLKWCKTKPDSLNSLWVLHAFKDQTSDPCWSDQSGRRSGGGAVSHSKTGQRHHTRPFIFCSISTRERFDPLRPAADSPTCGSQRTNCIVCKVGSCGALIVALNIFTEDGKLEGRCWDDALAGACRGRGGRE